MIISKGKKIFFIQQGLTGGEKVLKQLMKSNTLQSGFHVSH